MFARKPVSSPSGSAGHSSVTLPTQATPEPQNHDLFEFIEKMQEHYNFYGWDPLIGNVLLSVKHLGQRAVRVLLRTKTGSCSGTMAVSSAGRSPTVLQMAKFLNASLTVARFNPVLCPQASQLILDFDEYVITNKFKFGVVYQKQGHVSEQDIFSNNDESAEFQEFLKLLGDRIQLQNFVGFRGGLDTIFGQTGSESVYTKYQGNEIMFHVSTKLPFTEGDPQQLQRKRHIGNDIVALIFQDEDVLFSPEMVQSNFLHAYVVVRVEQVDTGERVYRVSVTARDGVPCFGPALPNPPVFPEGPGFRQFLLTKLINAEYSSYRSERFSALEERTRSTVLAHLCQELDERTQVMMGSQQGLEEKADGTERGFLENFKRAIRGRSHSFETVGVQPRRNAGSETGLGQSQGTKPAETPGQGATRGWNLHLEGSGAPE